MRTTFELLYIKKGKNEMKVFEKEMKRKSSSSIESKKKHEKKASFTLFNFETL